MRIWNFIVAAVYIAAGAILSFIFITVWAKTDFMRLASPFVADNNLAFGISGLLVILLGLIWSVNWLENRYKAQSISFDNPGGKIKVSLKAIEDYISSTLVAQVEGIRRIKVKARISSKGIETFVDLRLYAGLNIPDVCASIQEMTKNYLQDAVGLDRISSIEVFVKSIKGGGEESPRSTPGEIEE